MTSGGVLRPICIGLRHGFGLILNSFGHEGVVPIIWQGERGHICGTKLFSQFWMSVLLSTLWTEIAQIWSFTSRKLKWSQEVMKGGLPLTWFTHVLSNFQANCETTSWNLLAFSVAARSFAFCTLKGANPFHQPPFFICIIELTNPCFLQTTF